LAANVPCFPDFIPLSIAIKDVLHPRLSLTFDGVSEFTFTGLYLFRNRYNYHISRNGEEGGFIISGVQPSGEKQGKKFFMTPCSAPDDDTLKLLFETHDYWKNISETILLPIKEKLEERGIVITEDRDNFDYLYYRNELAELSGKKFHKKKNHLNKFLSLYPNHEQKPINKESVSAAMEVLDRWRNESLQKTEGDEGDYIASKEALELFDVLPLQGSVFFVDGKPAAFCLGESIARGKMFVIHFEKAIDEYKGIYQYVNQSFAASLPNFFTLINREQDLGNEGLRQAKETYRPCDFVRKYTGVRIGTE
jgi:hypothetical protein